VVGVNLALALAVGAGAVPRPGDNGSVRTAAVSQVEAVAAPVARQPGDAAAATKPTSAPAPAPTNAPTTVAKPKPTTPPTTKAPVARTTATTRPAAAASAPTPAAAAPAAPVKVARTTPSPVQVQAVITELKTRVGGLLMLVSPTPAQIDQAGDQICTAFDNGQSYAAVKATGLSMIPASIKVTDETAAWAVGRAVTLYCPGHANKLP
jgi:hypothetical protein